MAIQDQLKQAKSQQQDIPFVVVPDNYMQELQGQSGNNVYQYSGGPSVYAPFAPGTKTLQSQGFDEDKRAQANSEKLAWEKFEEDKRAQRVAEALRSSGGSGGSGGGQKLTAAEQLEAKRARYVDFAQRQLKVIPWESGTGAEKAFVAARDLMNQELAQTGLKNTDYEDILSTVAKAVGYERPTKSTSNSSSASAEELRAMLGLTS